MNDDAAAIYRARRKEREERRAGLERIDLRFSTARGGLFLLAIAVWLLGGGAPGIAAVVVAFVVVAVVHEGVARRRDRFARRVAFYENALARLGEDWIGRGENGSRYADPDHPYADDLDLFGPGSVFERLSTARTRTGEDVLASWLLAPAPPETVRERHPAVRELRPALDLREDLAVLGREVRGSVDSASLREWLEAAPVDVPGALRAVAVVAAASAFLSLFSWLSGRWPVEPFVLSLFAVWAVSRSGRDRTGPVLDGVSRPAHHLETLLELTARLERESFEAPLLARLRAALGEESARVSRDIARLRRLVELADSRKNLIFGPIAFALVWDVHVAAAVESWRRRAGARVARGLDSLGELEALSALAAWAFERPEDAFPEIVPEGPLFDAREMTHPLLPVSRAVRNDLRLDADRSLLVVTGSNMSGKSTLLRTVGTCAVLAQAGAPVPARGLRLSPLAVGTSIRVVDSLQEGRSRFYAEITRVRKVMDLARSPGLLFLLDEIFHGTNSADRRAGAEAVVRSLVTQGAIGLVTSHDLALADVADDLAPRASNVHFEDHLEGDRIAFDYRIKPGRVRKSNAIALMRAVGLEV